MSISPPITNMTLKNYYKPQVSRFEVKKISIWAGCRIIRGLSSLDDIQTFSCRNKVWEDLRVTGLMATFCIALGEFYCTISLIITLASLISHSFTLSVLRTQPPNLVSRCIVICQRRHFKCVTFRIHVPRSIYVVYLFIYHILNSTI